MIKDYRKKPNWFERNAGLGGWIGSVVSVLAIFGAWGLARSEYLRTIRVEYERTNSEISLIIRTADEFDQEVQSYVQTAKSGDLTDGYFYNVHMNDARFHRIYDLNNMPITQWPSIESYDAFKRYVFSALKLIETSHDTPRTKEIFESRLEAYEGTLAKAHAALNAAKR